MLIGIGLWIGLGILETPVFQEPLDENKRIPGRRIIRAGAETSVFAQQNEPFAAEPAASADGLCRLPPQADSLRRLCWNGARRIQSHADQGFTE